MLYYFIAIDIKYYAMSYKQESATSQIIYQNNLLKSLEGIFKYISIVPLYTHTCILWYYSIIDTYLECITKFLRKYKIAP